MKRYISPTSEIISLDVADVIAASPFGIEEMTPSGDVIEWEWAN